MNPSTRFPLVLLAALSVAVPSAFANGYQPADRALEKLEGVVSLTPDQEGKALKIFQDLKDTMDSLSPAERPSKGSKARLASIAAIEAILTPEQRELYDRTPQRLGGAGKQGDSVMQAVNVKIRLFALDCAKASPDVAAKVGAVQSVKNIPEGSMTTTTTDIAHPESGSNVVEVTGASGKARFKVSWTMDAAGQMQPTGVTLVE